MPGFIPPFDLGTFKPSAASLASWLYQIWEYLQQNPIPNDSELSEAISEQLPPEIAAYMEEHPATVQSVNGMIGAVIIAYADLVTGSTVPIYRATSLEITQPDLIDAWHEGCRFAVVDDTTTYVMLYADSPEAITLLPLGGGGGVGGIQSINTTIVPDGVGNALVNASNLPLSTADPTTIYAQIATLTNAISTINGKLNNLFPIGYIYMSVDSTDPGTIFGGTWTRIQDTFLLAAGSTYDPGTTGGEAAHTLIANELPHLAGTANWRSGTNPGSFRATGICSPNTASNTSQPVGLSGNSTTEVQLNIEFGGDVAHNNMPPYLAVYVWKRTA